MIKGIQYYHFQIIESTNTWAKEHVEQFDQHILTVISASHQTAGRGRFKRRWESPKDVNIYATYCCWIDQERSDIGHIPQLLALTIAELLESVGFKPRLKWPNDVLLSGKKVAGILCETVIHSDQRCVICGVGLNVNMLLEDLQKIDRPATSLLVESGQSYSVNMLLDQLTHRFFEKWNLFLNKGFALFFNSFKLRSFLKPGQMVTFHHYQQVIEGKFYSFNPDGSITLELNNQTKQTFYAGEFL